MTADGDNPSASRSSSARAPLACPDTCGDEVSHRFARVPAYDTAGGQYEVEGIDVYDFDGDKTKLKDPYRETFPS